MTPVKQLSGTTYPQTNRHFNNLLPPHSLSTMFVSPNEVIRDVNYIQVQSEESLPVLNLLCYQLQRRFRIRS